MIVYVGPDLPNFKVDIPVVTHSEMPHPDDTIAITIIDMSACNDCKIAVIRTRDPKIIAKGAIVVDVGGGELDHHSEKFTLCRKNGIKYASAGLMWEKYGKVVVLNVAVKERKIIDTEALNAIVSEIDEEIMIPIDQNDNGEGGKHIFSFIDYFHPTALDENPDYDKVFEKAQKISADILYQIIKVKIDDVLVRNQINFEKIDSGIIKIPSLRFSWKESMIGYNFMNPKEKVYFIISEYTDGKTWAAHAVPPSMEKEFDQLVSFPKEWGGKTDEALAAISGVKDAVMCHKNLFFARAKTKAGIIQMCKIAQGIPV